MDSQQNANDREDDDRPWEQPGAVRRDCEPDRGELLHWLGLLSLIAGALSFCMSWTAVVGIVLGMRVWMMSGLDLGKMARGEMDPAGFEKTLKARKHAVRGIVLSVLFFVLKLGLSALLTGRFW
jgi:hypothetical protein